MKLDLRYALVAGALALAAGGAHSIANAQTLSQSSVAPAPAPTPGAAAPHLTPQQETALKESNIRAAQNPVGSISIVPFQENANYGVGPNTRYQNVFYVQPAISNHVEPRSQLDFSNPHLDREPTVVRAASDLRVASGLPLDGWIERRSGAVVLCTQDEARCVDMGRWSDLRIPNRFARNAWEWKMVSGPYGSRAHHAGSLDHRPLGESTLVLCRKGERGTR